MENTVFEGGAEIPEFVVETWVTRVLAGEIDSVSSGDTLVINMADKGDSPEVYVCKIIKRVLSNG